MDIKMTSSASAVRFTMCPTSVKIMTDTAIFVKISFVSFLPIGQY